MISLLRSTWNVRSSSTNFASDGESLSSSFLESFDGEHQIRLRMAHVLKPIGVAPDDGVARLEFVQFGERADVAAGISSVSMCWLLPRSKNTPAGFKVSPVDCRYNSCPFFVPETARRRHFAHERIDDGLKDGGARRASGVHGDGLAVLRCGSPCGRVRRSERACTSRWRRARGSGPRRWWRCRDEGCGAVQHPRWSITFGDLLKRERLAFEKLFMRASRPSWR